MRDALPPPAGLQPPADGARTAAGDDVTDASQSGSGPSQPPVDLPSDWWQTGVVYQIYPRSFADAGGDGVGDLAGIADHLDHLGGAPGSLPVDAIWLSPIYPSPDFDFGYDVADYVGVDPKYGTLADFERLADAAHRRGIRIILDLVLNHSSSQHAWFQASRSSRDGPYADWYIWRDSPGRSLFGGRRRPNNWRSFFGGPAWTWDETRRQFYLHTFLPEQPDLNWRNPAVRAALLDVVRTWLDRGVDGFRLDVFNTFYKDEALRDNPRQLGGRGAWSWQRHVHDRAIFGDVDVLALAHLGPPLLDAGRACQLEQGRHDLFVDPVLRIVQQNVGAGCREPLEPGGVCGKHCAHVGLGNALALLAQRVEACVLGHSSFPYKTGRSPAAQAARVSAAKSFIRPSTIAARAPAVSS